MLVSNVEEPTINFEDTPGKTVGRRRPPSEPLDPTSSSKVDAEAWVEAFKTGTVPKGVYRFDSHEEADEWLWKMLTRKKES